MKDVAKRLKAARVAAGYKTAKEFAEKNDIPQSTYQLHETGKRGLSRHETVELYARKLRISSEWLLEGRGLGPLQADVKGLAEAEHERTVAPRNRIVSPSHVGRATRDQPFALKALIPLIGTVQAGAWKEAYETPEEEWEYMALPTDPRFPGIQHYALRNAGESMNKRCPDGGLWIFVRFVDLAGRGPGPGDYVVVERIRKDGLVEATAKKFGLRDGRPWLFPDSTDDRFQPVPIPEDDETEEVRVTGLITGAFAPFL